MKIEVEGLGGRNGGGGYACILLIMAGVEESGGVCDTQVNARLISDELV
jgi:hypothetical protein